ncbi:hypothetical protein [Virgisporangium ochraceum]|uniref:Uncharacterized protein n=1 Tax=Virgisporangium ochraceum TaxID=65505 RepID=A0A8J3ZRN2_9ACTN|nr:hypothetical protein [Virgisporangium ochraceum]GIJ68669.1 hypothetical protein Voc01_035860 [Virgisporangium ochraceum]
MNLWHALRRECAGAWRSVRYDLATHRSARLAGAYTEEFQPSDPPVPAPSRLVPLTGVTLLLIGGAAGAFLAISGGLAAIGEPGGPPAARDYAATASTAPAVEDDGGAGAGASPVPARRAAADPRPSLTPVPSTPVVAPPPPVTEATSSSAPPSASTSASTSASPSASASASESDAGNTEGPRSRGHRGRR